MATLAYTADFYARDPIHSDRTLNARGLSCPLPILNTRKSVENLRPGETLKIISTDSGSVSLFESLARQTGLVLVYWQEQDGEYQFFIRNNRAYNLCRGAQHDHIPRQFPIDRPHPAGEAEPHSG